MIASPSCHPASSASRTGIAICCVSPITTSSREWSSPAILRQASILTGAPQSLRRLLPPFSLFGRSAGMLVLLISRPGEILVSLSTGSDFIKGLFFGSLSGISFGTTIIMIRYLRHDYTGISQTFWLTGVSLLFMLPSALLTPASLLQQLQYSLSLRSDNHLSCHSIPQRNLRHKGADRQHSCPSRTCIRNLLWHGSPEKSFLYLDFPGVCAHSYSSLSCEQRRNRGTEFVKWFSFSTLNLWTVLFRKVPLPGI